MRDETLDKILDSFDVASVEHCDPIEKRPLTIWIPSEYKTKYDSLQEHSKRKFGKVLREVLKRSIEKSFSRIEKIA